MIADKKIALDGFISASAPLEDGPAWFERLITPGSGLLKVVLLLNG